MQTINERKIGSLGKVRKKYQTLSQINNVQLGNIQANKIRNEKGRSYSNTKELQRIIKTYFRNFILPNERT